VFWREAGRRGWRRVLAAGAPSLVEPLESARPHDGPELVRCDRLLATTLTPQEVRRAAEQPLAAARTGADRALAERVRDAALSASGRAAFGVDDVLTSLAEGRVQHLLIDPRRRPAGARAPDGRLAAEGEMPPGAKATTPEPHLAERILERALATGARVTALTGPATEPLDAHDGVAAALRW
jgi:peptide subunit release factor 1 (eRF1)